MRLKFFFTLFVVILLGCGCFLNSRISNREYKETRFFFSTYITLVCSVDYNDNKEDFNNALSRFWDTFKGIEEKFSIYSKDSEISRLNRSGASGVKVSRELIRILNDSVYFSQLTDGAFDITILPLIKLWKSSSAKGEAPGEAALSKIKKIIGYKLIGFKKGDIVYFRKRGMEIDLGAIAKGYAVDQAARVLKNAGIKDFLIDAGGDIYCSGAGKEADSWIIGIQDPQKDNGIIGALSISSKAVATSGNYRRFYKVAGKNLSHIINPKTGRPEEKVISSTVVAPYAEKADAIATALCIMEPAEGMALVDSLDEVEAMVIESAAGGPIFYRSNGWAKLLKH